MSGSSIPLLFPHFHPRNRLNFAPGNRVFSPLFSDLEFRVRPGRNSTTPGTSGLPRNFRPPELPSLPRNFRAKQKVYPKIPLTPALFPRPPELPEPGTSGHMPGTSGLTRNFPRNFSISLLHRFHHNFSVRTPI